MTNLESENKILTLIEMTKILNISANALLGFLDRPEFRQFDLPRPYRRFFVNEKFKELLKQGMKTKWFKLESKKDFYKKVDLL